MKASQIELLAPAGDFDKLKVAVSYGADAVYIGGSAFGLRSSAGNFSISQIEKGINFAHKYNTKVYLVVNTFPNNSEIKQIENYLGILKNISLDALIIADPGVISLARELTPFNIHLSTQSSVTNIETVKFWRQNGISRIVLGREVSIEEAKLIYAQSDMELELFIHGSMCMSYSGKCTISNYTANRDANRGGCVNSCRWEYSISNISDFIPFTKSYAMNSKDLWAVDQIPEMIDAGISSLKIEGRMKSHLYLSNTVSIYRKIIDNYLNNKSILPTDSFKKLFNDLPNRGFSSGFLKSTANRDSILYDNLKNPSQSNYIGIVKKITEQYILLQTKNTFHQGDSLIFYLFTGETIFYDVSVMYNINQEIIPIAHANSLILLPKHPLIQENNVASLLNNQSDKQSSHIDNQLYLV